MTGIMLRDRKMTPSLRIRVCILVLTIAFVLLMVTVQLFDVESPVKHLVVPLHSKIIVDDRLGRYINHKQSKPGEKALIHI